MRPNRLRELLGTRSLAVNAWLSNGNPYTAEVLGQCGYDAVTVDLQHGMFGVESAIACLQAISATPAIPIVRCRSKDAEDIGHLLDAGAYGVICPSIDSVDDAARFVAACRYPPTGRRSFGPSRGLLYGGTDYASYANDTVLTIGMIESPLAIERIDDILAAAPIRCDRTDRCDGRRRRLRDRSASCRGQRGDRGPQSRHRDRRLRRPATRRNR